MSSTESDTSPSNITNFTCTKTWLHVSACAGHNQTTITKCSKWGWIQQPEKNWKIKEINGSKVSKRCAKRERVVTWWNLAAQKRLVLDSYSFVPVPTLKHQNPLLSYVREKDNVYCKCIIYCTVHFIITLFNVGNVSLRVIYQLNFTVFMYVTRISGYI
jgi:hypothetical protein